MHISVVFWRKVGLFFAAVLGLTSAAMGVRAQEVWTSVSAPTTQDLWGVCSGGGQFVAVGKGGTILTSPDGSTWTARASGTDRWLTAVTYGAATGRYVAVGEEGVILVSDDVLAWRSVATPTTRRLNAVIEAFASFVAVGEGGIRVVSDRGEEWFSGDLSGSGGWLRGLAYTSGIFFTTGEGGVVWQGRYLGTIGQTRFELGGALEGVAGGRGWVVAVGAAGAAWRWTDPRAGRPQAVTTGVTTGLGAVTFANNLFVAVGDSGTAIVSDDGAGWAVRATPTMQSLRAVAASDRAFVAVGLGGAIVRSDFAPRAPRIVMPPVAVLETAGSSVALTVRAAGSGTMRYQWFRDGAPIVGATEATLVLPTITVADAGNYTVEAANDYGAATSSPAKLTVTSDSLPNGLVDPAFAPAPSGPVYAIQPLADGRAIIGGDFSYTRTDGSTQQGIARLRADGQFDPTFDVGAGVTGGTIAGFALQPDGKVIVGGGFTQVRGEARARLVRLNPDGTLDTTFTPPSTLGAPTQLALLADGRIVLADGGNRLSWLYPDGTLAYLSQEVPVGSAFPGGVRFSRFDIRPTGAIVAAGSVSSVESYGWIAHFRWDGSLERHQMENLAPPFPIAVRVLDNGDLLLARQGTAGSRISGEGPTVLTRVSAQDGRSTTLATMSNASLGGGAAWLYADGRAVLSRRVSSSGTPLATGPVRNSLQRFNADGSVDNTFLLGPGIDGQIYAMAAAPDGSPYVGGAFTSVAGTARTRLARLRPSGNNPTVPQAFVVGPRYVEVRSGEAFTLHGQAAGTGPLKLSWQFQEQRQGLFLNPFYGGSSTTTLTEVARDSRWTGLYSLVADGPAGTTVSEPVFVKVVPARAPVAAQAPVSQRVGAGRGALLSLQVADITDVTYQWYRNGVALPGQAGGTLFLERVTAADAGLYAVVATNALGSARLEAVLDVVTAPALVNVATRAPVSSGDASLIVGFVVAGYPGSGMKSVLARGVGPGLAPFGVTTAVADPRLTVFDSTGRQIAANDNWREQAGATPRSSQIGFPLAENSKDAALDLRVANGAYTAQVSGVGGAAGVALAEIYEDSSDARLGRIINLSTRAFVGTGEGISIPGFVLEGEGRMRVLVRGVGPGLAAFGVNGTLSNPTLTLLDKDGRTLATNDDWSAAANADEVAQAAARAGAFALGAGSRDAALVIDLPAGNYTARVTGVGGETGVGLVEVYEVP